MMKGSTPVRKGNASRALRRANAWQGAPATTAPASRAYLLAADAGSGGIDRKRSTRLLALLSTSSFHMPELS
jgi:hypothetical protein